MKKVSIILLNYKGAEDTIACLKSLLKISYAKYDIVIVDNASPDDSVERIEEYFKSMAAGEYTFFRSPEEAMQSSQPQSTFTLLQTGHNGGYGYGNNVGIKYALKNGADYVLLLNNDTVVDPGFIEPIVQMCEEDKSIGIASGQIFYFDHPDIFWFNGGTFSKCTGKVTHIDYGKKNTGQKPLGNSTFITGCLWLVPKYVFEKVGLINEKYFMYVEDVEFSQRIVSKGYCLKVTPHCRIWHKVGSSSAAELTEFSMYWMTRNRLSYMAEHAKLYCWPLFFYNSVLKFFIQWLLTGRHNLIRGQFKGLIHSLFAKDNK